MKDNDYETKFYVAQAERLLLEFNFFKVYDIMKFVGWKWEKDGKVKFSPEVEDLKNSARELLMSCIKMARESDNKHCYISSGGLAVRCDLKEHSLSLCFEPVSGCMML